MKNGKILSAVMLAAGVVLGTFARIYIIVAHTDMRTGFLYHGDELLCNLLYYGIIIAAAAAAMLLSRKVAPEDAPSPADFSETAVTVMGFVTLAAGMCAAYEGYRETRALAPPKFLIAIDFIFGALMIAVAFGTLGKKKFTPLLGYSYSMMGVYCTLRGLNCFITRMAIVTVPEYLIEVLGIAGLIMFFVMLAKILSGNSEKHTYTGLCFWGVIGAGLTLSSALATIFSSFAAPAEIRIRITSSRLAAEGFRQACEGVNAYKLVYTPWVNVALAVLVCVSMVIIMRSDKNGYKE